MARKEVTNIIKYSDQTSMLLAIREIKPTDGWHTADNETFHFFIDNKSACGITKGKDFVQDNDPSKYCKDCVQNRNPFLRGEI